MSISGTNVKAVRRTLAADYNGKRIVIQIGVGDMLRFRYERERTWIETSIKAAMTRAAMSLEDREQVARQVARGKKFLAKRGRLSK